MYKLLIIFLILGLSSCNETVKNSDENLKNIPSEKKIDSTLILYLENISIKDQYSRIQLDSIRESFGDNSPEEKKHWKHIVIQDSINMSSVDSIVKIYGWLGVNDIGRNAYDGLFFTLQHANNETQERYLPILRKALEEEKVLPNHFAMFTDRIAVSNNRDQTYGTQLGKNLETNEFFLYPVLEPDSLDFRRNKVGLDSIHFYLKGVFDINWDVEKYKESLSELRLYIKKMKAEFKANTNKN